VKRAAGCLLAVSVFALVAATNVAAAHPGVAYRDPIVYAGSWQGDTDQGYPYTMRVSSGGKLTKVRVQFDVHGSGGCVVRETATWTGAKLIKDDHFRVHIDDVGGSATIQGDFVHKSVANGTYSGTSNTTSGCAGHAEGTWRATK
jgi:hypothetical protein